MELAKCDIDEICFRCGYGEYSIEKDIQFERHLKRLWEHTRKFPGKTEKNVKDSMKTIYLWYSKPLI